MSDWIEATSDEGQLYYFNPVTNETSWSMPEAEPVLQVETQWATEEPPAFAWISTYDEGSGMYYFTNTIDGTTTWDMPPELQQPQQIYQEASVDPVPPSQWVELYGEDGSVYYHNTVTNETSWTNPEMSESVDYSAAPAPVEIYSAPVLAAGWVEVPQEGDRPYYYHAETGSTQWDMPVQQEAVDASGENVPNSPDKFNASPRGSLRHSSVTSSNSGNNNNNMSLFDATHIHLPTVSSTQKAASSSSARWGGKHGGGYAAAPDDFSADLFDHTATGGADRTPLRGAQQRRGVKFQDAEEESKGGSRYPAGFGDDDEQDDDVDPERYAPVLDGVDAISASGPATNKAEADAQAEQVSDVLLSLDPALFESATVLDAVADKLLHSHCMERYAELHFQYDRPRGAQSAVNSLMDRLLTFQADVLKAPLTAGLSAALHGDAAAVSRYIHCFMGDKKSSRSLNDTASALLRLLLASPSDDLRDEAYCQLVRQTRKNPSGRSTELGWQLMLICLITYSPSKRLLPFLFNYLSSAKHEAQQNCMKFLCVARKLCLKAASVIGSPRREAPTQQEIQAVLLGERTEVGVYTIDSAVPTRLLVDSFTTAAQLETLVHARFGVEPENRRIFALFSVSGACDSIIVHNNHLQWDDTASAVCAAEERVLAGAERVLDLLSSWIAPPTSDDIEGPESNLQTAPRAHEANTGPVYVNKLMFKVRFYFPAALTGGSDSRTCQLLYHQARHNVLTAYYPYTLQDAALLAAVQLQTAGDYRAGSEMTELRGRAILQFVAKQFLPAEQKDSGAAAQAKTTIGSVSGSNSNGGLARSELEGRVVALYRRLSGTGEAEARAMYLALVGSWKLYGSTLFLVQRQGAEPSNKIGTKNSASGDGEVVLAVGPQRLVLVDAATAQYLAEFSFAEIVSWGHSFDAFVLIVAGGGAPLKFQTAQGKEIDDLLRTYLDGSSNSAHSAISITKTPVQYESL